jgi:hypothetical protein
MSPRRQRTFAGIGHRGKPAARLHPPVVASRHRPVGELEVRVDIFHHLGEQRVGIVGVGDNESARAFRNLPQRLLRIGA